MELAIFGAIDRYNYGDLLFPLILKEYLKHHELENTITYYGLVEANFEAHGSVKVRPFGEFYNKYRNSNLKNIIIVAGGRVAAPKAGQLFSFLKHTPWLNLCSTFSKVLHVPNPADIIAQKKLDITWGNFPLCPVKPNDKTLLLYNAIGGNSKKIPELIASLQKADYISIRNPKLFHGLQLSLDNKKLFLCPDSASVMSKIWPKETLDTLTTDQVKHFHGKHKNGYITFQAKDKTKWHISTVSKQLRQLHEKTNLPILLIPIGRAHKHEDHFFLNRLAKKIGPMSEMVDVTNLHDIMYLISHSTMFIGTSLHGNITAMSYGVPHLGITHIPKLDQYLKHWDIEPNNITGTVKPSQICHAALNVLKKSDTVKLMNNAERLSMLSNQNLNTISTLVGEYVKH